MVLSLISSIGRIFSSHGHASWFLLAALVPFFLPFVFLCVPLLMLFLAPASCILLFLLLLYKVQVSICSHPKRQHRDKRIVLPGEGLRVEPADYSGDDKGVVSENEGTSSVIVEHVDEHHVDSDEQPYLEGSEAAPSNELIDKQPALEAVEEAALIKEQEHTPAYVETTLSSTQLSGQEGLPEVAHQQDQHVEALPVDIPDTEVSTWPPVTAVHPHHYDESSSSSSEGPAAKYEMQEDFEPVYESFALETTDQGIAEDHERLGAVVEEHWEDARETGCKEFMTDLPPLEELQMHGHIGHELRVHEQVLREDEPQGSLIKPPLVHEESELITQPEEEPYAPHTIIQVAKSEEIEQASHEVGGPLVAFKRPEELELLPAVPHTRTSHEESEIITQSEEEPYPSLTIKGAAEFEEIEQAKHEGAGPLMESKRPEQLELSPAAPHTRTSHEESELTTQSEEEPYPPLTIEGPAEFEEIEQAKHEGAGPLAESNRPEELEISPAAPHTRTGHEESELITQSEKEPYSPLTIEGATEFEEIEQAKHKGAGPLVESKKPEELELSPAAPHTCTSHEESELITQSEEEPYPPLTIEGAAEFEEIEQAKHEGAGPLVESKRPEELELSPAVPHTSSSPEESEPITQPEEEAYTPHTIEGVAEPEEIDQAKYLGVGPLVESKRPEEFELSPAAPHTASTAESELSTNQPEEEPYTPPPLEGVAKPEEIGGGPLVEPKRPEELELSPAVPHTVTSHKESELITQPEEEQYASPTIEGFAQSEEIKEFKYEGGGPLVESKRPKEPKLSPAVPHTPSSHEESELITQSEEKPYTPHTIEGATEFKEIEQAKHEAVGPLVESKRPEELELLPAVPHTPHAPYTAERVTESAGADRAQLEEKPCSPHAIERVSESEPAAQSYGSPGLEEARMEATANQAQGDTEGVGLSIVPKDKDDVVRGETSSAGSVLHERSTHTDVKAQDKVDEEQLLADLCAIQKIVGYIGGPHASVMEQIDALYIFLGMEPLYWTVEVNDLERAKTEIELLKVVVGVK